MGDNTPEENQSINQSPAISVIIFSLNLRYTAEAFMENIHCRIQSSISYADTQKEAFPEKHTIIPNNIRTTLLRKRKDVAHKIRRTMTRIKLAYTEGSDKSHVAHPA